MGWVNLTLVRDGILKRFLVWDAEASPTAFRRKAWEAYADVDFGEILMGLMRTGLTQRFCFWLDF
ncbi:hypothetical protein A1359_02415 [Methylomonas lenta]|uniref:Uncharacterized protein n=2 Tax=Methylomonas lenta TaxID=980561 RepID=A0A177NVZ1_9GAMM|nr:hypothetical protein A1359_02415 [Methylomonas lenta]